MAKNKVWITKKGKRLPIKDMGTSHIENCIDMLEKERKTDIAVYNDLVKELETRNKKKADKPEEIKDRSEILDLD